MRDAQHFSAPLLCFTYTRPHAEWHREGLAASASIWVSGMFWKVDIGGYLGTLNITSPSLKEGLLVSNNAALMRLDGLQGLSVVKDIRVRRKRQGS